MARIHTRRGAGFLLAGPLAAGLLLIGAGAAVADDGAGAESGSGSGSNAGVASNTGTGNVFGGVDGNYVSTQQTATGAGASNQDNTLAVKDNTGNVQSGQDSKNVNVVVAPTFN
ncbi:hypothetical protein [Streptomyces sp. CBMA156]|uniref:hypothetical protein n=1 Tax=Streptomyces sp. CBMA156 TaxID=1930280 RepID=UPI001661AD77|nr:hypothetical protein [Streptomyces sp. CBMA156]MBD0669391.1 hypothetical protein [Streptomyces sp. CBMA156]